MTMENNMMEERTKQRLNALQIVVKEVIKH